MSKPKKSLGFQQNPQKYLEQKLTPQKSQAEFPSINEFGGTQFIELHGKDTQVLPQNFR